MGFLPDRSTVIQLLNILDKWTEALHNGAHVDAIYCDFIKAFDRVPYQRLLRVLRFYNTPKKTLLIGKRIFLVNAKNELL